MRAPSRRGEIPAPRDGQGQGKPRVRGCFEAHAMRAQSAPSYRISREAAAARSPRCLRGEALVPFGDPHMERLGGDVSPVGPGKRPQLPVELNSSKVVRITERFEDTAPRPIRRIDLAADAVLEGDLETMRTDDLTSVTRERWVARSMDEMLGERIDALQWRILARPGLSRSTRRPSHPRNTSRSRSRRTR
jgi:hypothetical protein